MMCSVHLLCEACLLIPSLNIIIFYFYVLLIPSVSVIIRIYAILCQHNNINIIIMILILLLFVIWLFNILIIIFMHVPRTLRLSYYIFIFCWYHRWMLSSEYTQYCANMLWTYYIIIFMHVPRNSTFRFQIPFKLKGLYWS